jgi:dihydropteroate synthase
VVNYEFFYPLKVHVSDENTIPFAVYTQVGRNGDGLDISNKKFTRNIEHLDKSTIREILIGNNLEKYAEFMSSKIFSKSKFILPKIMGIANLTPDSFYEGSRLRQFSEVEKIINSGADILDLGAESTRPGAIPISPSSEISRLEGILDNIKDKSKIRISLDSRNMETVLRFIDSIDIINDVSALSDERLSQLAVSEKKEYVLMHARGNPRTMNSMNGYTDLFGEITYFFFSKLKRLQELGMKPENIIIDPGLGFAKIGKQNLEIIRNVSFLNLGFKRLIGHSRKSFLGDKNKEPITKLPETLATSIFLAQSGVEILRVHDPLENINALNQYFSLGSF